MFIKATTPAVTIPKEVSKNTFLRVKELELSSNFEYVESVLKDMVKAFEHNAEANRAQGFYEAAEQYNDDAIYCEKALNDLQAEMA